MGKKTCKKCGKSKTYGCFPFNGKGKGKKRTPGSARGENCLSCK